MGDESLDVDTLISHQNSLLELVKKQLSNFKKDSNDRKTKVYFEKRLSTLESYYANFHSNHKLIIQNCEINDEYIKQNQLDLFEETYFDTFVFIQEAFEKACPKNLPTTSAAATATVNTNQHVGTNSQIRLPKINIPTFSGDCLDWPSFSDAFKAVHNNRNLSPSQKFQYLKGVISGPAELLIKHLKITDENYSVAMDSLDSNYNDKRLIFNHQMNAFQNQPCLKSDNVNDIRNLINFSGATIRVMANLGVAVSEPIMVHLTLQKLSPETRQFCLQNFPTKVIPNWADLEKAIDIRLNSLPAVSNDNQKQPACNSLGKFNRKPSHFQENKSFHVYKADPCAHCKNSHVIRKCKLFLKLPIINRKSIVEKHNLCYNCLGSNHNHSNCPSQKNCFTCGGRHHTLLHLPKSAEPTSSSSLPSSSSLSTDQPTTVIHNTNHISNCRQILLATAIVKIFDGQGNLIRLRALLDQGSQATLITENAAQRLGLPKSSIRAIINGIGDVQNNQSKSSISLIITSCHDKHFQFRTDALVLHKLTHNLPSQMLNFDSWEHIRHLPLADPNFAHPSHIDLLLGADVYAAIIRSGLCRGNPGSPIAQNTALGWILSGEISQNQVATVTVSSFHNHLDIDSMLRKFWEIEEVPTQRTLSADDKWCEKYFVSTHKRQSNGKYLVHLPLKSIEHPAYVLGASRQIAINRFYQLENRFRRDPILHSNYSKVIQEYMDLGQMELEISPETKFINAGDPPFYESCYLPHHPVIKESSSTTKLRVVFDASTKTTNSKSLNDILHIGPTLQTDLTSVILRWRIFKFVFTADIEKMYRRIDVHHPHTQYQKIIWRNDTNEEMKTYRLNTVTFGTASAPFTAIRVMHQLATDEFNSFPLAAYAIRNQMYVDDVLSGNHCMESALETQRQIINCLKRGGFELRKWSSNSPQLIELIPPEHRELKFDLALNSDSSIKCLGLLWKPANDNFHYQINFDLNKSNHTKRTVLSTVARLFDPLGLLNPIVIKAKIFLKQLWCEGLDWDDCLPDNLCTTWQSYIEQLEHVNQITVPRWINIISHDQTYELHTFCDGSMNAYSAATYIRVQSNHLGFSSHLLMAKCKVSPKKQLTIPRIELCGAELAVKLHKFIMSSLMTVPDRVTSHFWTDSTIVLSWIKGDPSKWKTFVSNRIHNILSTTNVNQWHHVPTADNPSDASSRGIAIDKLIKSELWWCGPNWLQKDSSNWPKHQQFPDDVTEIAKKEMKKTYTTAVLLNDDSNNILQRYSSYIRLHKIISWCVRFINNARKQVVSNHKSASTVKTAITKPICYSTLNITVNDWKAGFKPMHLMVQRESFSSELQALINRQQLPAKSKLIGLNPFIDAEGVIRVGGRLKNSTLTFAEKHPIILPASHHFTKLIIDHHHISCLHGGVQLTLNQIRKRYWILHGKRTVGNELKKCRTCFKSNPIPNTQLMGDLPHARVRPARPFSSTGVDYAGPIDFRMSKGRGNKSYKGYISVFVCLCTKAIHLEAVSDMSTAAFIAALQRFFARRGLSHDIYSDCGTTFIGAKNQLKHDENEIKALFEKDIIPRLTQQSVNWHFIPPYSPHFGGLWEAGVKSTKYHLKRIVPNATLTFEEMSTVLCRIESCLNSRPLCPLSDSHDDLTALTPGHFLIGDAMLAPPEPIIDKINLTNRWHQLQKITHDFWTIWSKEYLSRLQIRPKWNLIKDNVSIGELVLIKDDRVPVNQWKLGRVTELHQGADQLVRVVSLKTKDGIIKRPIVKICSLPWQNSFNGNDPNTPSN